MIGKWAYVFTDVEGSTQLWRDHEDTMRADMARMDQLVDECLARVNGARHRNRGEGDSHFITVTSANLAAEFLRDWLPKLRAESWATPAELRVRAAIHLGESELRESDFYGNEVNFTARLRGLAWGWQVLVSEPASQQIRSEWLHDLGVHRVKDAEGLIPIHQLALPGLPESFPPLRGIELPPNNLPAFGTTFVGRGPQMTALVQAQSSHRCTTLVGAGGTGKTRLAVEFAHRRMASFPSGAWFIDLSQLSSDQDLEPQIRRTLELPEHPSLTWIEQVRDRTSGRPILLVFDNCEHLIDAAANTVDALLFGCPDAKVLCTSRAPLELSLEKVIPLDPLEVDGDDSAAVRLFRSRAELVGYLYKPEDSEAVEQICRGLDGLPLAIEIAAARLSTSDLADLELSLANIPDLLASGRRTSIQRQRNLESLIRWSYDLCDPLDQEVWKALSLLPGPILLEAAEAALPHRAGIDRSLGSLHQNSLLNWDGESVRFLKPLRDFAFQLLGESPSNRQAAERQLLGWTVEFAEDQEALFLGGDQSRLLTTLDQQYENLREGIRLGIRLEESELAARLGIALSRFWRTRGFWSIAEDILSQLVEGVPSESAVRAKLLSSLGIFAWKRGDLDLARVRLETASTVTSKEVDSRTWAAIQSNLGLVLSELGLLRESQHAHEAALEVRRAAGHEQDLMSSLNNLGLLHWHQDRLDSARALFLECLVLRSRFRDLLGTATTLNNLGLVETDLDLLTEAEENLSRAHTIFCELQDPSGEAQTLFALADVTYKRSLFDEAREKYLDCQRRFRQLGDRWGLVSCDLSVADIDLIQENWDLAIEGYTSALLHVEHINQPTHALHALMGLAAGAQARGETDRSILLASLARGVRHHVHDKPTWHCPVGLSDLPEGEISVSSVQEAIRLALAP